MKFDFIRPNEPPHIHRDHHGHPPIPLSCTSINPTERFLTQTMDKETGNTSFHVCFITIEPFLITEICT
jgi:hypothetical protein